MNAVHGVAAVVRERETRRQPERLIQVVVVDAAAVFHNLLFPALLAAGDQGENPGCARGERRREGAIAGKSRLNLHMRV